ncbi:hypothetical protein CR513_27929, partial [Mucuna pruriens]
MEVGNQFQTGPWRHVHVKLPDMQSLWYWGLSLKGQRRRTFEKKHGNLIDILNIQVQPIALEMLVQYYDTFLRSFTFNNFQIAPILEEYERLLGLPLETSPQYLYRGKTPSWSSIAKLLRVTEARLSKEKKIRNGTKGIYKSFLDERLHQFRQEEDWPAFMDVYGLAIYGLVLFPHGDDYIDMVSADAYMARRDRGENPTMALLANTYYTLNHCCERRGGYLRYCIPLLYLWMTSHLFHSKTKSLCPIEDFKWCCIKIMSKDLWAKLFDQVTERTIRWYPAWNEREEIIVKCGGFPNVPLLGTLGAINYNPELLSRQVGYPVIRVPQKEDLRPFLLHGLKIQDRELHKNIRHAWRNVIKKGKECGSRSCGASTDYRNWLTSWTKKSKSPQSQKREVRTYEAQETVRVRELEEDLAQKEMERRSLKSWLEETSTALAPAEQEIYKERQLGDQAKSKAQAEEKHKLKIGSSLKVAYQEMCFRRLERDQVILEKEQLKEALVEKESQLLHLQKRNCQLEEELAKARSTKEQLISQRQKSILELTQVRAKAEDDEVYYRATIEELRSASETWKQRCQDIADEAEIQVRAATIESPFWKDRFIKLAWLGNQALVDIPRSLRAAESLVDPTKTPREVLQFLELKRRIIAPYHIYHTRSKAKNMEDMIESLEQQNQELRGENQGLKGEMMQIREQMNKLFELFTQKTTINVVPAQ